MMFALKIAILILAGGHNDLSSAARLRTPQLCYRLVAQQDIPVAEGPRLYQLQREIPFDAVEHRPPSAKNEGIHNELAFIDQACLSQLRNNAAASKNNPVLPLSFFILGISPAMSAFTTFVLFHDAASVF